MPEPGEKITGLILLEYNLSLCALLGVYASLTAFRIPPLFVPAGENQGKLFASFLAQRPAISPFRGTYLKVFANLSNIYLYPLSKIA